MLNGQKMMSCWPVGKDVIWPSGNIEQLRALFLNVLLGTGQYLYNVQSLVTNNRIQSLQTVIRIFPTPSTRIIFFERSPGPRRADIMGGRDHVMWSAGGSHYIIRLLPVISIACHGGIMVIGSEWTCAVDMAAHRLAVLPSKWTNAACILFRTV